jgi:phytoene synthase
LRDTIQRFSIPLEPFHELVEGMRMDLDKTHYATFEELRRYCYHAASTVGLICIEIFGHNGRARAPAIDLGVAMQLVNVLRDVSEDYRRGRIYLPREDLDRAGYTEADLARGTVNGPFRQVMALGADRAREHFARAEALLECIEPASRKCPALLARFYLAILDQIECAGFDVFSRRPRLSLPKKLALAGASLFGPAKRFARERLGRYT